MGGREEGGRGETKFNKFNKFNLFLFVEFFEEKVKIVKKY